MTNQLDHAQNPQLALDIYLQFLENHKDSSHVKCTDNKKLQIIVDCLTNKISRSLFAEMLTSHGLNEALLPIKDLIRFTKKKPLDAKNTIELKHSNSIELEKTATIDSEEFSDWEVLSISNVEERIECCINAAKDIIHAIEDEEWVFLSEDSIDNMQASFIRNLQQETGYTHSNILDHILCNLKSEEISNSTPITFENGKMVSLAASSNTNAKPSILLLLLLADTYGAELAWRIMNRYQLIKKEKITWEDVKKALLGMSTNFLISDLQFLFKSLSREPNTLPINCTKLLTPTERKSLRQVKEFQDLTTQQKGFLLKAFQTLPMNDNFVPMLEVLYQGRSCGLPIWQFDCFEHDTEVSKRITYIDDADRSNLAIAISEHMCKNIIYMELKTGMIVPMLTEHNKLIYYYVCKKLSDKKDGVICSLMAPLPCPNNIYTKENPLPLHLNFRGTQWQPDRKDSYESLQRDLEYAGIGKTSYQQRSSEILEMVLDFLKASPTPWVKLVINGHSLGGTDAQRALRSFVNLLAQPNHPSELNKIVSIDTYCHNSPAPEASLNDSFDKDLQSMEKQHVIVPIRLTLVLFATDPLQNAGDMYLGAQTKSSLLTKQAVFAKSKLWRYFSAHRLKAFVGPLDPCDLTFIDSSTSDDLLEKIFSRNYYWSTENNTWGQITGKRVQWYGGYALKPIKGALCGSFYLGFSFVRSILRSISTQRSEDVQYSGWGLRKTINLHPSSY